MLGQAQPQATVPAGAVQDEDNLLVRTSSHGTGESGQFDFEQGDADGRG